MKKQNWKKVISLVAGSLVIALVVSILPGGFLVNAAEVRTAAKAESIALEKIEEEIDDEKFVVVSSVLKDQNEDRPYYLVVVKSVDNKDAYEVKVYAKTGRVNLVELEEEEEIEEARRVKTGKEVKSEDLSVFDDFDDFEDYITDDGKGDVEDFIRDNSYANYGDKPTAQAALNELLKDGKKAAISDFKESEDKIVGKEDFKDAKDFIKDLKTDAKAAIKNEDKVNKEKDDDKNKELVNKVKLTNKQVLLIALQKVGLNIDSKDLDALGKTNKIADFENIFKISELKIELADNENPSVYKLEFVYKNYEYKIEINATSGKILEYERESLKAIEIEDEDEDKDDDNPGKGNDKAKENKGKNNK